MPNPQRRKNPPQKFSCPQCHGRLWRVGGLQYFLNQVEVKKKVWLEDFFCPEHGKLLMYVSVCEQEKLSLRQATKEDWQDKLVKLDMIEP